MKYSCNRNICIRNEYANVGCEDCEITKANEELEIISADLKKGMQFNAKELYWFQLNCASCYNSDCKYIDKPAILKESERNYRCKNFMGIKNNAFAGKYVIACIHSCSMVYLSSNCEKTKNKDSALLFESESIAKKFLDRLQGSINRIVMNSLDDYENIDDRDLKRFISEQAWKVCHDFYRCGAPFNYPSCPLDYDILYNSIIGLFLLYAYEYVFQNNITEINFGDFPISFRIGKFSKWGKVSFCNH